MAFDANKMRELMETGKAKPEPIAQPIEESTTWTQDRMAELNTEIEDSAPEETYTFDPEESRQNFNAIGTLVSNTFNDIARAETDYVMAEQGGDEEEIERARVNAIRAPFKESAREFIAAYGDDNKSPFQSFAQGLRQSSANIEYFMSDAERLAKAREIGDALNIPAGALMADTEAMQNAMGVYDYAKKIQAAGGSMEKVYQDFPKLAEIAGMDPQGAALALHDLHHIREVRDVTGAWKAFWQSGEDSYDYGVLMAKEAMEGLTDEEKERAEALRKSMENAPVAPSFFVNPALAMLSGVQSLPEMIYSTGKAVPYAVTGGVIGAAALGTPTFGAGAPAGFMAGAKKGFDVGLFIEMARPMMGRKYAEYQAMTDENGNRRMTDSEARERAIAETIPEALIELGGFKLGVGKAALGEHAKKVVAEAMQGVTRPTAGRAALGLFGESFKGVFETGVSEAGEEFGQSVVSDIFDADIARAKETGDMGFTLSGLADTMTEADWGDITKKAVAQGMEAVPGALFLGGVSSVGGAPMGGIRYGLESRAWNRQFGDMAKTERTIMTGTVMLEQLQAAVHDSNLQETAPDVQREILRDELKDTPWQIAYVDVETALKNESGLDDVREAGKAAGMTDEEIQQAVEEKGTIAVPLECYAQSAASPELLDSVSFSPEAEPLAKIRENAKAAQEAYTKRMTAETQKQIELVEAMTKELFPEKREQDAAMNAIFQNPENPAQGWRELHEQATAALDEILAPALSALERGMGQGVDEIRETNEYGEAKGDIVGRVSNNEEWYREFYKEHKRKPTKAELREMARKMMTGEADAPQVQGWTVSDKETAELMANEKDRLAAAEEEIALLESVKERMQELNGAEMKLTEGMSPEAYKVYRTITTDLLKFGGKPGRAARVSALLWARHADVYAKRMRTKKGFENYTATDWLKNTIRGIVQGRAQGYNQANVDNGTISNRRGSDGLRNRFGSWDELRRAQEGHGGNIGQKDEVNTAQAQSRSDNQGGFSDARILDILNQAAWHGSPYIFRAFDLGAIGTGEGAQAHGWGLYFAKDRKIAEGYKERLANKPTRNASEGELIARETLETYDGDSQKAIADLEKRLREVDEWLKDAEDDPDDPDPAISGAWGYKYSLEEALDGLKSGKIKYNNTGALFQVEIPDDDVLLDEQKTFEEQPEKVQKALLEIAQNVKGPSILTTIMDGKEYDVSTPEGKAVEETVDLLEKYNGNKDKAIEFMEEELEKEIKRVKKEHEEFYEMFGERSNIPPEQTGIAMKYKAIIGYLQNAKELRREEKNETLDLNFQSGKDIYEDIADLVGGDKEASEILNKYGVKGITYVGGRDGRCYVVFDDKAISIIETYNQAVAQGNLGRTVSYSDGTRLVELFESADESTFLHESGHIFLMDLEHLAAMGDEESKADLALVEEWAAFRDGDEKKYRGTPWAQEFAERARRIREAEKNGAAKMPDGTTKTKEELLREWKQERFARAFEMYLKEGKAPSKGLRGVFRKFCDFLKQVYMALSADGARASAQVEAVMGRLLATDEEIEAAAEDERYQDFMKAGGEKLLYEDAAETFSRWHEEAKEEARDKLRKIVMRSLTGKMARRRKEILRNARITKETELSNQPVYLARQAAKETGIKDAWQAYFPNKEAWEKADKTAPTMEEALDAYMRKYEADLDTKDVQNVLKEETIEKAMSSTKSHEKLLRMEQRAFARKAALANRLSGKPRRRMEDVERWIEEMPDALDKDDMGTWHKAVTSLKLSNRWTKEELDAIDKLSVSASKEAAQRNFEALRKIIKERKVGLADLREANRGRVEALRKQAKETIRKQTLAQATQVATHRKAEKEAAKEAEKLAKQEKWAEAAAAKERELLAAFMATEAEKVRNRRDAILKHIRAQLSAKTKLPKDERYWHQHLAYLLRIADTDAAKPDGLKSLAEIAKALGDGLDVATDEDGRSDLLGLMAKLADENTRKDGYHGMKLEELEDAADVLTVLYTTGRDKFNLKLTKGKTIGEAVKEILEDRTAYNGAKVRQSTVTGNPNRGGVFWSETLSRIPGAGDALAKAAQRYGLSLTKPEELINLLGEKAHKYIYDTYDRAAEQEAAMTADFVGKMEGILAKRYTPQEMREWQERKYDWRGQAVSKENILAMALNLGNEINMDRLVSGLQTNEAEITQFIAGRMTEKDWLFCQDVWDLLHEYWPETVRVEMELNGTRLVPQTARAFNVKTKDKNGNETEVKLRGGYYPIKYDPELSDKARETAENAEARASMSGATVLGIGRGFTKDRAAKGAVKERPLLLSLSVIPEHVGEAVHNITTRIAARDVLRILNHADMKAYVNATLGMDAYNVLTTWATDVWKIKPEEGNSATKVVNSLLRPIRQNAGIAIMGYRMWPTVENATNIFPMMDALGAAETLAAIKDYYGNKAEFDEMIAKSMFMRERTERMDRDMKGQRGMFERKNAVSEWLVKHAYDPITFTDLLTSKPLWARAYKNAFPKMLEAVRKENEENAKTFAERRAEYDKINATILDMRKRRQEMEAELRRRARREAPQAETAYTRMSRTTLQDEIHILDGEIEDKGKALFVAGEKMERASTLVIRTERETLDEATQRAVLAADKAVRDVIGSGDVKDLSEVQRSRNEAVKALTMFYSYFNTQANAIISAHWKGKWQGGAKYDFTPVAKAIAYRFLLTSLLSTVMRWALFGEGDDDKDKYKKDKEGHKIEVPALQRFLTQYAKNALSTTIGGAYGLREVGNQLINRLIEGRSYGARFDGMYGSLYDQTAKAAELIWMKRERDEKAREEEEKRQERYKNATPTQRKRMRQEERYRKPPNTISYADILRSVGDVGASLTAGYTGATAPLVGAVLGTMQYLFDSDGRYDATLGNMMWSAFWTKKPVKKKPPEKPEKPKKEQKGR